LKFKVNLKPSYFVLTQTRMSYMEPMTPGLRGGTGDILQINYICHMSFDTVNSSYAPGRNMSNAQKRELLWNILEPGDPYDIKRSMIAKLPGDKKLFMGDHLEIVALFQAAEI
jgi:hypothetical protein